MVEGELISECDFELGGFEYVLLGVMLYDVRGQVECDVLLQILCQIGYNVFECVWQMQILWVIVYWLCCKYWLELLVQC